MASLDDRAERSAALPRRTSRAWRSAKRRDATSLAVAVAALILLASAPASHVALPGQAPRPTGSLSLSPVGTAFRPASMGLSAGSAGAAVQSSSVPNYDEQIGATFTQDLNSLAYNVTALAQTDANGYGPGYLLNGLTTSGYWYQVGVSYHWPSSSGGYDPGFGFSYQVFGANGKTVYPFNGGAGLGTFSKAVDSGDSILLSLTFNGSTVLMFAQDWSTGATAQTSFSSEGSSSFVGSTSTGANSEGFFTGIMTEWYHVLPYSGNEGKVTYSDQAVALSSAWLWIDEFESGSSGPPVFENQTQAPVAFANPLQIYPFTSNGATIYGSAHQFITGLLNAATSRVALTPATAAAAVPSFVASYTLAGSPQSATIAAGTSTVEADPGTSITVAVNPLGSSAAGTWVFSGTSGTEVTFAAGTNATYVYYQLVQETVSYQVAGGGQALPASSAPQLSYEEPPSVASATPAPVAATQLLGTAPAAIYAVVGSVASVGTIPRATGERWAASTQNWTVSTPNSIADPLLLYQQYEVGVGYTIVGGGTPPQTPEFLSTAFGSPVAVQLSSVGTTTLGWLDVGSSYSFTSVLNGTTDERWTSSLAANPVIGSPNEQLTASYAHQYYGDLASNEATGGAISQASGWFDAGNSLSATASANANWRFEGWNAVCAGGAVGCNFSPTINITVAGPFSENATFYPELTVSAGGGTNVDFSYGSQTGTVLAGTTKTLYVPPSSNVTLRATPSVFIYSFASWQGTGLTNATKPSLALVVDSPSTVTGTSSYNYPVILGGAATVAIIVLAVSLSARSRRSRKSEWAFPQT